MNEKFVSISLCTLLIISGIVPLTGPIKTGAAEEGQNQGDTTRSWIPLPDPLPVEMILEQSVCRRMSVRYFTTETITDEELSTVLWAAYGRTTTGGRTVYSPNGTYSTTLYVIRSDATYIYVPENHSLLLFKTGNYLNLGEYTAPIKFGLVWNNTIAPDEFAGMLDIGMIGQNIYFEANALDLGTVTTGGQVNDLYQLGLPPSEKPEIIMPLGHPSVPYSFTYDPLPEVNLPPVVNSTITLADAVTNRSLVTHWEDQPLSLLEESQTLWCSYGTSYLNDNINNKHHRTLPSAIDIYPFKVYAANQSGVYLYEPATHAVTQIVSGDQRELIQEALAYGNISIVSAPWIILPFWDKNIGSQSYLRWWWYEAGAIIHNVFLEGTAQDLDCNVVTVISDQPGLRSALGLAGQTNLVGMAAVMVGHSGANIPPGIPTIQGPSTGNVNIPYDYSFTSTDPDGDNIFYSVDWGDNTTSGWVGPVPSGVVLTLSHTWSNIGSYDIKAKAKDVHGAESAWSMPFPVTIRTVGVAIKLSGGLGIAITLQNIGDVTVTDLVWGISFEGGFIIPAHKTGTISALLPSGESTVRQLVFGFGKPTVTVSVMADDGVSDNATANISVLLFFVGVK
jgi:nitroreductase